MRRSQVAAGLLWLPYSYALLAALGLIGYVAIGMSARLPAPDDSVILTTGLLWVPLGWGAASVLGGLLGLAASEPAPWWVRWCAVAAWVAVLPARAWAWMWTRLLYVIFHRFLLVTLISAGLGMIGAASAVLISSGADGWIILIVLLVLSLMTWGGVRWGNQYGGGMTGGFTPMVAIVIVMLVFGVIVWGCILLLSVAAILPPALLALLLLATAEVDAWMLGVIAIAAVLAFVAPFARDRASFALDSLTA